MDANISRCFVVSLPLAGVHNVLGGVWLVGCFDGVSVEVLEESKFVHADVSGGIWFSSSFCGWVEFASGVTCLFFCESCFGIFCCSVGLGYCTVTGFLYDGRHN